MNFIKKVSFYMLLLLLLLSIYTDLTTGTSQAVDSKALSTQTNYRIIKVKISAGDNVLSVAEQINTEHEMINNVQQIMSDFKNINPQSNPHNLHVGHYYYRSEEHTSELQ